MPWIDSEQDRAEDGSLTAALACREQAVGFVVSAGNEQVFAISDGDKARSRSLIKRRGWGAQR